MNIKLITFFLVLSCYTTGFAQVGIGNTNPAESSLLDIRNLNADKGILIPRVSIGVLTTQAPIKGAIEESLLVYNTNTTTGKGFYYWDVNGAVSQWVKLLGDGDSDSDWFVENTRTAPDDIDANIYTNGNVGINVDDPDTPLHIFEETGTVPGFVGNRPNGSLILEHGNNGGTSSIVFRSAVNADSDYGYIGFEDNGSVGSSTENGLLTIGIENDVPGQFQDDINIAPSGELKVSLNDPDNTDYNFSEAALIPFPNNTKNLGGGSNQWNNLYVSNEIINTAQEEIDIRIGGIEDYRFTTASFTQIDNGAPRDLGAAGNRWGTVYTDIINYRTATQVSDIRLKENINRLNLGLEVLSKIETYDFNYKKDGQGKLHYGVIAQELQDILPALVHVNDDEISSLSVNYIELIPILINAIKEQQQTIESQGSKIEDLASTVAEIKTLLLKDGGTKKTSSNSEAVSEKE